MNASFYGFGPTDDEARSYRPAGLTGARAGARLAGATTSGAPTAGSFRKGDAIWGQDGSLWICTVAGSPGTFVQAGFASPLSAKGDLIVGAAGAAASRLGVGSDNQVLTADSAQSLGVKWAVTPANAGGALTQIAQTVLSSSAGSITFGSIAGTYSALRLILNGRGTVSGGSVEIDLQCNSDSGANYDWMQMAANNAGAQNQQTLAGTSIKVANIVAATGPANGSDSFDVLIPNYAGTTFQKTVLTQFALKAATTSGNIYAGSITGWWRNTAAITSITLTPASGSFASGTVATLYGLS